MPKKAVGGESTVDLLAYLFGPGNHEEHTDPHLVAAWTPALPVPRAAYDAVRSRAPPGRPRRRAARPASRRARMAHLRP